jgi:serine/threonine protein kinase
VTTTPQITGEFPPGYEIGGFVIEEVAGRGAMGVVYRAAQPALGRLVALKVIAEPLVADAAFRERFEREARAAAPLGHPNIVSVHEAGELDGVLYIAMQWVDGGDLRHHIAKTGPLPPIQASRAVSQIAEALDVAHAAGILHRDVKPANILLRPLSSGLHAYLTDFGVTRPFVELGSSIDTLTQNGQIVGTPGFLAPEQIEGRDVDGRADLYALCCVLFEALTGRPPFQRDTAVATLLAHTSAPRPLVSEVNPNVGTAFDDLVRRGLAINRDERFADGKALIEALAAVLKQPQRLPRVTPLRHNTIDDLGTEVGQQQPRRRRIVVSFEGEGEEEPSAAVNPPRPEQPRTTGSAPPAVAPSTGWPAPAPPPLVPRSRAVRSQVPVRTGSHRRARTNVLLLIAGVLLMAGALLALALWRGGDGADATTTADTTVPAASVVATPKPASDARRAIASTLRAYARAFAAHDATALSDLLAQDVHRRAGGAPGATGCGTTSTRRDALAIYRAQFETVTGYTLPQLHSSAIAFLSDSQAAVATRAHISTVSGAHDEVMRFVLRFGTGGWRISTIEGAC